MFKIYTTLVLIFISTYAESQIVPTNSPYYNNGSYTVVSDSNLTDLNNPLLFYYPQTSGTYPVLMFQLGANGFGSSVINRHTYDLFVQHLASYGFVVIVIDDSQAGLPNGASFIETHDWFKNKVIDPSHWLSSYADPNQLVIGGHSNGGVNASALLVDRPTEIDGIIFMDAYPSGGVFGFGAHDVSGYSGKVLTLSANENDPTANKEGWDKFTSSECKTFVDISGLDHGGFGDYVLASQPVGPIGRTDATASVRHFLVSWMLSEYSTNSQATSQLTDDLLHPNTVHEFVNDCGLSITGTDVITACDSYTWIDGNTYTSDNNIATDTLTSANNLDSIVTLDLTILNSSSGTETYAGCENDGYNVDVNGVTYDESNPTGTETFVGGAINGCDSIVTVDLEFYPTVTGTQTYIGYEGSGYSVDVNGTTYDESNPSGNETFIGGTVNGCDSTVNIDLQFLSNATGIEAYTGCEGDGYSVDVNGTTYNELNTSGTEVIIGGAASGSDSTVVIDLQFLPSATGTEIYAGCENDGYSVEVNGTTYNESNPTGTETFVGGALNGCDSIVTIDLQFLPTATGTEIYAGCENDGYSVEVNGTTYNESNPTGTETFFGGALNGCDSIVAIDLTFGLITTTTDEITACQSYTWINGVTYTQSNNTATYNLAASNGCDSIINLDLTIEPALDINVTTSINSSNLVILTADQDNASYQWLDCDNNYAVISGETNQSFNPDTNGSYAVSISSVSCADTSICVNVTTVSLTQVGLENVKVFPNPSNGKFTVKGYEKNDGVIEVIDAMGRNIKSINITSTSTIVDLQEYQKGIYFFKVIQNNNELIYKVIIN